MSRKVSDREIWSYEAEVQLCELWFRNPFTDDDREWLRAQFELCDVKVPEVDISWVRTERIR